MQLHSDDEVVCVSESRFGGLLGVCGTDSVLVSKRVRDAGVESMNDC